MLRPKFILLFAALLALIGLIVVQMQPPTVTVAAAETGRVVDVVYATGTVRPDTETQVAAEVAGRIVELPADEGDRVRFGQVLARLDDTEARIRLREAENRLETARARVRQAEAPTDPYNVQQLEAQVRAATARVRAAQERVEAAGDRIETARSNARAVGSTVEGAQARARAMRNAATAARNEIDGARQRAEAAQAEVNQARANQEAARDLYRRRAQLLREGAIAERMVTEARTAMNAAEAAVKAAQNRQQAAEQAIQTARANAAAAQAQYEDALAAIETARANTAAAQSQVQEAVGSVSELDRQVEAARQEMEAIRSQLDQARRGQRSIDIEPIRTELRTAESAVAQARQDLTQFTITSPVAGRVTDRPVDPGDYVASGNRVMTVANEDRVYVRAEVDEADIGQVRVGAETRFQVDARPEVTYTGRVARIGDAADPSTKTYPVEIRNLSTTQGLRIGMTADVNIQGRVTPDAVLVPTAALQTEKERIVVWVVDAAQRVHQRPVRIKARDASTAQIVAGLLPGERVVLNPTGKLQDGRRVRVAR